MGGGGVERSRGAGRVMYERILLLLGGVGERGYELIRSVVVYLAYEAYLVQARVFYVGVENSLRVYALTLPSDIPRLSE